MFSGASCGMMTALFLQISGNVPPPQFYSEREKFQLHRQQQMQNQQQQMEIQQLQQHAQHRSGLTLGQSGHPTPGVSKHGYANVAAAEEAAASLRSGKITERGYTGWPIYECHFFSSKTYSLVIIMYERINNTHCCIEIVKRNN